MTGFSGANPDELDALARSMDDAADRLGSAAAGLDRAVTSMTWSGPDASRFRASWANHRRRLQRTRDELAERAIFVRAQADDQRRASASTPGSLLSIVPPGSAVRDGIAAAAAGGTGASPMVGRSPVGVALGQVEERAVVEAVGRADVGARLGGADGVHAGGLSPVDLVTALRSGRPSISGPGWLVGR